MAWRISKAFLWVTLPTVLQLEGVFLMSLQASWADFSVGRVFGVALTNVEGEDPALRTALGFAQNMVWLALTLNLVVLAVLVAVCGRRHLERASWVWLPMAFVLVLIPVLVVGIGSSEKARALGVGWLLVLLWPFVMTGLALWARSSFWHWFDQDQEFLRFEFNTVLPAWSPKIENKQKPDQKAKYGGHRAKKNY